VPVGVPVSGDRARGDWTPWPVVAGQLELEEESWRAEEARRREYDPEDEESS
jgi:hypothetical protein